MASSEESLFASFKSKKILRSASSSSKVSKADGEPTSTSVVLNRSPWSSKTPEKPTKPPRRTSNRLTAFSLKKVREAAENLRESRPRPCIEADPIICDGSEVAARSSGGGTAIGRAKKADDSSDLPERYQMLVKFFDSLDNSIRLLCLKGSISTFSNISPKIEAFTNRRFTYSHLAQIKFILPEAIEIKKILIRDELTCCMKPNLHITINIDAIDERKQQQSGHLYMRKIFRTRLLDYSKTHPEGDIPEETLPEPFNKSRKDDVVIGGEAANSSLAGERLTNCLPAASHLSKSFRRSGFSMKGLSQTELSTTPFESIPVSKLSTFANEPQTTDNHPSSDLPETPLKETVKSILASNLSDVKFAASSTFNEESQTYAEEYPSSKETVIAGMTPMKLTSVTPALKAQKRLFMTPHNDNDASAPGKLLKRPPRSISSSSSSRALKFDSPIKCKKNVDDDDILDSLPDHLLQSIREKEMKAMEERDPAISQAKWRRKMISNLPKLFDTITYLYQSIKRSVLTKADLIQKIISSHLDTIDRREIEEQIRLLQELAPEWIYEKLSSTGDLLIYVNKLSNPETIRARMAEAK